MVNSKKLLSLFLAVVMVLSAFTVMASAYTVGEAEGSAQVEFKYSVEKVDTVPETAAGSAEYTADNIYAVTLWMKSALPVDTIIAPFHYNKTLFAPITLFDGEVTYPYGAGLDPETYYTDMGEGTIYAYSLGDYMNNTGMYKANGTTATTKALAKCIGLGNANAPAIKIMTEYVSPDHVNYARWSEGVPADTGILFAKVDVATSAKTAYLNTIEGIETNADWNRMFTLYFETITDADVTGAEFGIFADDVFGPDACYDANGKGYYESPAAYDPKVPTINMVSNAVIEETVEPSIVAPLKGQIRFDKNAEGAYAGTFDIRALATITEADFTKTFTDVATATAMIKEVGFVFAAGSNVTAPSVEAAKALVEKGEAATGYTQVELDHISTAIDGNYTFSCIVNNVPDAQVGNSLVAIGYIGWDSNNDGAVDTYNYYDNAQTVVFSELFETYYDSAFPA